MKKRFMILFFLAVIICLSACGKKDNPSGASSPSSNSSAPSSSENSVYESSKKAESDSSTDTSGATAPTAAIPIVPENIEISDAGSYETQKRGWGMGTNRDAENRPISCDDYQKSYGEYGALFIMPRDKKTMYLTFDEGYENGYTEKILDALKEKNCPAVFFVTMDYVKGNPELIRRMIDEGHVIGNHSVKHKSQPTLSPEEQAGELSTLHNYMVEEYGYQMTLFRPPMGEWSVQSLYIAKQLGYKTVFWSFAYQDWIDTQQMGVDKAFPKVSGAAHNGAIYLLHAVSKDNANMMGDLIDNFKASGYSLEKLQ